MRFKDELVVDDRLYEEIKLTLVEAREKAYASVNFYMVEAYWNIGRLIGEGQNVKEKTGNIRQFYISFKNRYALRSKLRWTHYRLLMGIEDEVKRAFYIDECIQSNWSTRQLERQIESFYYERLLSTIIQQ